MAGHHKLDRIDINILGYNQGLWSKARPRETNEQRDRVHGVTPGDHGIDDFTEFEAGIRDVDG